MAQMVEELKPTLLHRMSLGQKPRGERMGSFMLFPTARQEDRKVSSQAGDGDAWVARTSRVPGMPQKGSVPVQAANRQRPEVLPEAEQAGL